MNSPSPHPTPPTLPQAHRAGRPAARRGPAHLRRSLRRLLLHRQHRGPCGRRHRGHVRRDPRGRSPDPVQRRVRGPRPSTPGEELTAAFLVEHFQAAGLGPGNGDSFFQNVPLVALTEQGQPALTVRTAGGELEYAWTEDFVA